MFGKKKNAPAEAKPKKVKEKRQKKQKPQKPPKKGAVAYEPIRGLMGMGDDYHIYTMTMTDRFQSACIGAGIGIAIGYVFFNLWSVALVLALVLTVKLQKPYREYLLKKRQKRLLLEFKDLLETLSSSYSAGMTTVRAFQDGEREMTNLYGADSDIAKELRIINVGLQHNFNIEDLLLNFAARCGLDDVDSFANVFEVCNRKGGNLKQIVGETRSVINDKIEMEMEIQTMVAASKNELNIMMVMPFIIMISMRGLGDTMTSNSLTNLIAKVLALVIFIAAYALGNKMVAIKL